ncbi:MAG: 3-hydroxyacyl-ACP dehydratase FabZ [bacterium]
MVLNFEQIRKLIPQRFPFSMIDKVTDYEEGKKIIGVKNITGNEVFFQGHFPDEAIMPGALILEAMAQTALVYFKLSQNDTKPHQSSILFAGVKARFLRPVVPGDVLKIEMTPVKIIRTGGIMEGVAKVNDTIVTKAELTFSAKEKEISE